MNNLAINENKHTQNFLSRSLVKQHHEGNFKIQQSSQ